VGATRATGPTGSMRSTSTSGLWPGVGASTATNTCSGGLRRGYDDKAKRPQGVAELLAIAGSIPGAGHGESCNGDRLVARQRVPVPAAGPAAVETWTAVRGVETVDRKIVSAPALLHTIGKNTGSWAPTTACCTHQLLNRLVATRSWAVSPSHRITYHDRATGDTTRCTRRRAS